MQLNQIEALEQRILKKVNVGVNNTPTNTDFSNLENKLNDINITLNKILVYLENMKISNIASVETPSIKKSKYDNKEDIFIPTINTDNVNGNLTENSSSENMNINDILNSLDEIG